MNIVEKLERKNLKCCGCTACFAICPKSAIKMQDDNEGFKYPVIDSSNCVDCNLCCNVCPLDNVKTVDESNRIAFAATAKDESITAQSSSGGVFALLANIYADKNAVIYGAAFDDVFHVIHLRVDNKSELKRLYASKYVQSDMGDTFKSVRADLEIGKEVLFAGTPCQVAGLKSFLMKDYSNLLTVDFICHGVPSPKVWQGYIKEFSKELNSKIADISFRSKKNGWKKFGVMLKTESGKEFYENSSDNIYMKGFLNELYLRSSCHDCRFKNLSRVSDITLADFWGVDKVLPEMNNDKGVSLCWANSDKGTLVLNKSLLHANYKEVKLLKAIRFNKAAVKSVRVNKNRNKFFEELNEEGKNTIEVIEKYYDDRNLRKRLSYKLRMKLKNMFK